MKKLNGSSRVFFCVFFLTILCCNFIILKVIHNDKYGNHNPVDGFVNYNDTVIMPEDQQTQMQNEPQSLDNEGGKSSNSEADIGTVTGIEKDNIKTLYSVNTTIWTLAMSTFAVFFQFNSNRDAQGYNPKGVHFRILNLEARLKEFEKDRSGKRGMASNEIPSWVFTPFYGYFISLIVTTVFYFFSVECEKCKNIDILLFFLLIALLVSIAFAVCYIVKLLISMYSQKRVVNKVLKIIEKSNELLNELLKKLAEERENRENRERYIKCQVIVYDAFDVLFECTLVDNERIKDALCKYQLEGKIRKIGEKIKEAENKTSGFWDRFRFEENDNINIQLESMMLFISYKNDINASNYRLFNKERQNVNKKWMNELQYIYDIHPILLLFVGIGIMYYIFKKYLEAKEAEKAAMKHECDKMYKMIYGSFFDTEKDDLRNYFVTFYRYLYIKEYDSIGSDKRIHDIRRILNDIYPYIFMEEK